MLFLISFFLLLAAVENVSAAAAAASTCSGSLGRCFSAAPTHASAYCSSYMGTYTSTITPTSTSTVTRISTVYSTSLVSTSQTQTLTTTTFVSTVSATTLVITTTTTNVPLQKRALERLAGRDITAGPACLTRDGTTSTSYPATKIFSACSCIGITRVTTSVPGSTLAPVVVTQTQTSTVPATTVVTTTIVSTTFTTQSVTATSFISTSTSTQTATSTVPCGNFRADDPKGGSWTYRQFYQGSGYRLNDNNSGNADPNFPPVTTTYAASGTFCSAVSRCAGFAAAAPSVYWSYAVYKQKQSSADYECEAWFRRLTEADASYFNVADPQVSIGVGYFNSA